MGCHVVGMTTMEAEVDVGRIVDALLGLVTCIVLLLLLAALEFQFAKTVVARLRFVIAWSAAPLASLCVDAILFLVLIGRGGAGAFRGHLATFVVPPLLGEGVRAVVLYKRAKAKQSAHPERITSQCRPW